MRMGSAEMISYQTFGSGSSAYQVEGAVNEDGRTPSIWDTYTLEDVRLIVETGLDAYRFSISWSRLIPNGRGPVNPKGLAYYNNLINELISHGKTSRHMLMCALKSWVTEFQHGQQ